MKTTTLLRSAAWLAVTVSLRADEPLPGTAGWTLTGDPAGAMVEGIHRWLDAKIARGHVAPEGTIDEFRSILGIAADTVQPGPFERQTSGTVTWPVFREVTGEGWLLEPDGPPKAAVLVIPPVDAPADAFPIAELYRRVQARVLVLGRVGRNDGPAGLPDVREARIDRREFLWRAGFELGRTPSSYELQMCLAGLATLGSPHGDGQPALPLAVVDMDRGTLGFRLGRLCPDLKALGVVAGGAGSGTVGETPLDTIVWGEAARTWERLGGGKLWVFPSAKSDMDAGVPHFLLEAIGGPMTALGLDRGKVLSIGREELRGATPDFPDRALADRLYARLLNDTQHLMREAEFARATFWKKADLSSAEAFAKSAAAYREHFRREVMGELPVETIPPNPRSRPVYDTAKLRGWEVTIDVMPDVFVSGILLLPKDLRSGEKRPAIVCQHGLEGRPSDCADPNLDHPAYHAFAARLCERGYVVFAPQAPYIGEEKFRSICRKAWPMKLSLWSFILRQHEGLLAWLGTQDAVDSRRIAFYGLSYGGKAALRVPALLDGYCLSICSGDYNEWVWKTCSARAPYSYLYTKEYDMVEWNFADTFNHAELSWLIFPRPFMVERGHDDGVSCDEWVAYEYARTRRLYDRLGLGDRTEIEFFNGPHTIHGQGTFRFLDRWLKP